MNAQNFDFAKPKLFFKNIGSYAATSTYILVPFNFTMLFNTKQAIAKVYSKLLDQREEPFKSITITAMAMSMFNTVRITQLKEKTVLILDVVHLHEKQQHLEEKLDQRNKLLADLLESNIE